MVEPGSTPRLRSKWPRPPREDSRVQFLVFLPPDLVKRLKGVAHDRDEFAYQLVERVLRNALDRLEDRVASETDWPINIEETGEIDPFIEGHREKWTGQE